MPIKNCVYVLPETGKTCGESFVTKKNQGKMKYCLTHRQAARLASNQASSARRRIKRSQNDTTGVKDYLETYTISRDPDGSWGKDTKLTVEAMQLCLKENHMTLGSQWTSSGQVFEVQQGMMHQVLVKVRS